MPTFDEIKSNPVFLTGVIVGIIGIGVALYGYFGKSKSKVWTYSGVALAIGSFAVAFGSAYMPVLGGDSATTRGKAPGVVPYGAGVTTPA